LRFEKIDLLNDIYYSSDYISLYIKETEDLFNFQYIEGNSIFINKSIKRPIKKIGNVKVNDGFYDLETAYGYGGFYTNNEDEIFLKKAMMEYYKRCKEEKIIAEFIRFHPFNNFPIEHGSFFDFNIYDRDTVIVDLNLNYNTIVSEYSSSLKRKIKKEKKNNLKFEEIIANDINISIFIKMYTLTMNKKNADNFYFFDINYFKQLFNIKNCKLYVVKQNKIIINMIIIFVSNDILYYHLGATDDRYYHLSPNPLLFDSLISNMHLKYKYLYLGGGTSSLEDDSLLKFKQKFSKNTKPFYISGKIYNIDIFDKYNRLWQEQSKKNVKYFLQYRLEIK